MAEASARVLFVEDDAGLAGIVVRHLRACGHDARAVESAEDATAAIKEGFRPTVVLLDINLPGASGWDLLRSGALRAAGSPPVYVVSATNITPSRLHEFNVAGYLPKPFAMSTLVDVVERCTATEDGQAGLSSEEGSMQSGSEVTE